MTEPSPQQNGGTGAETASQPAPVPLTNEFVIVDAPMPDHSATEDVDETLSTRGPERTSRLLDAAKGRAKSTRSERMPKEPKAKAVAPRGGFVKPLTEMYGTIALLLMPFDAQCAMAIMEAAPKAAESLDNLAKTNDAVKRVLITLTQTSAWGAVIAAHAPIILAITVHHVPAVKNSGVGALLSSGVLNGQDANAA